jgi:hypothetical protein
MFMCQLFHDENKIYCMLFNFLLRDKSDGAKAN